MAEKYADDDEVITLTQDQLKDILALLKDRGEIKPKQVGLYGKEDWYGLVCVCPDCTAEWMGEKSETHFCPNCGQGVEWE